MIQQKNIMSKILVYIQLMLFFHTMSFLLSYQVKLFGIVLNRTTHEAKKSGHWNTVYVICKHLV